MLAIDSSWYSFTPPQWSNIPPPLTSQAGPRDPDPRRPGALPGRSGPESDQSMPRCIALRPRGVKKKSLDETEGWTKFLDATEVFGEPNQGKLRPGCTRLPCIQFLIVLTSLKLHRLWKPAQ